MTLPSYASALQALKAEILAGIHSPDLGPMDEAYFAQRLNGAAEIEPLVEPSKASPQE